jgi:hypothetical protein
VVHFWFVRLVTGDASQRNDRENNGALPVYAEWRPKTGQLFFRILFGASESPFDEPPNNPQRMFQADGKFSH